MNKAQVEVLKAKGFAFEGLPGLHAQPRAKYYSRNRNDGHVVQHNLPADPYSLEHYLAKGFTLNPNDLKPWTDVKAQEGDFVCEVCGRGFTKRIALAGHSRTHKK